MASSNVTLQISQGRDQEDTANCSVFKKRFGANATTRNMIDLVLVIVILVLLGIAAPVIRGRCHDVDECSSGNNSCPTHARCINVMGSYTCECYQGYQGNNCLDVDECKLGIHKCDEHANCTNTMGSYKCICHTGFYIDGISCKDVNECKAGSHKCDQHTNCLNTNGSYKCV